MEEKYSIGDLVELLNLGEGEIVSIKNTYYHMRMLNHVSIGKRDLDPGDILNVWPDEIVKKIVILRPDYSNLDERRIDIEL